MRDYELTTILNPNFNDDQITAAIEKVETLIKENKGSVLRIDKLGRKELPSLMKKHKNVRQGVFVVTYFQADSDMLKELDRKLKLNDDVLRFMVVKGSLKPDEETVSA